METTQRRPYTLKTVFLIIGVSWGSAAYGYAGSIIATTLGQPSFLEYMGLLTAPNAADLIGAMNGLFYAGGFVGAMCIGKISDRYGRKFSITLGAIVILISNALLAGSVNPPMFIVFRFFQGLGAFIELTTVPLWITEIVPPKDRGMLSDIHPIFINVGYVTASYVGVGFYYYKSGGGNEWRAPLALGCLPCILTLICVYFAPESPRYLLIRGEYEKAWQIVRSLHHSSNNYDESFAREEFRLMREQIEFERINRVSTRELLTTASYRKRLFIGCGLPFILMSSGVLVINNYGTMLYSGLGYDSEQQLQLQAGWLAVSFVMNIMAVLVVDRLPRPHLITIGMVGCVAAVATEAALQAKYLGTDNRSALAAGVAMLYVYVFFYAVFLDGPTYFYLGEIFPNHLRSQGMTMGMGSLCLANIIWLQAAPKAFETIGWHYYLFFIIITAIGAIWVFFTFPDTRNLPLEEIAALFGDESHQAATVRAHTSGAGDQEPKLDSQEQLEFSKATK
ncbi:hypothetical protein CLAIMM_05097 [Cladophialophora immunda]|nr:hypothetical protein CLAIMM_05097 [Cladophialophora immunda]